MTSAPSRQAALAQLNMFKPDMGEAYARTRNFDLGPRARENVSGLSPWLRSRLLAPEEVLDAAIGAHGFTGAEAFIQQVFWRAYFKGWLEHQPDVWERYQAALAGALNQIAKDGRLAARYAAACEGQTGIACFDAWAVELVETGYLHNHARMWFASIWIFTLKLPWELGADFFFRHLLDGDAAANTCSWRWVGGLHTQGKTYLARADNIAKFTRGRFADTPGLASEAVALKEATLAPKRAPDLSEARWSRQRYALLITEEDCLAEALPLPHPSEVILVLNGPSVRSPLGMGEPARAFAKAAVEDCAARAAAKFGVPVIPLTDDAWVDEIADAGSRHKLDAVVTARLPVGPTRARIRKGWSTGDLSRIERIEIADPFDAAVWPHTKAGYFKLKERIADICARGRFGLRPAAGARTQV
jgi:deoxyribodipyrimidine photo-lyase